jgi:hypothetical protein
MGSIFMTLDLGADSWISYQKCKRQKKNIRTSSRSTLLYQRTLSRKKKQSTEWEKIFPDPIYTKGLYTRDPIYTNI